MRSQPPWLKVGQPSRPPTQKEKAMPYCTVETENEAPIKIHYEDHGSGQPVVLLHGFPDSGRLWRHQVPALTGAGYRVIVPDMRGYGRSARPVEVDAYNIPHLVSDVVAVLADAGVPRAHVVGHDWGAAAAWALASVEPESVHRLVALSIGHPATFRGRPGQLDLDQLEKSWFMLLFQFPGVGEEWLSANQWSNFRSLFRHPDEDGVIADLEAKSSLTPGLNYFRALVNAASFLGPPLALPPVQAPTLGVWSSGDFALTEAQMTRSAEHVAGPWRYARLDGPATGCSWRHRTRSTRFCWTSSPLSSPGPGSQGQAIDPPPARAVAGRAGSEILRSPPGQGDRRSVTRATSSSWRGESRVCLSCLRTRH